MSNSRFWLLFTGLFPVILAQGIHTKRTTVRLPEASGERFGHSSQNDSPALKLVVIGESTVAGVGVSHQQQGLAAQVAMALEQQLAKSVQWFAYGKNGIKAFNIAPGIVRTEMSRGVIETKGTEKATKDIALERMTEPKDIAPMVTFIASGMADHATGSTIDLNAASYMH